MVVITVVLILILPSIASADYYTPSDKETDVQYNDVTYDLGTSKDNYSIDYSNIPRENISEYKFSYDFSDIILSRSNETKSNVIYSDKQLDMQRKNDDLPNELKVSLDLDYANSYKPHEVDLSNGTYKNTTYDSGSLYVKEDHDKGTYKTEWKNYSEQRSVKSFNIEESYDKVEYRTDPGDDFSLASDPDGNTIQSVPSGLTSNSFQYKIYLNNNRSKSNESYIYQIEDQTTLQKIDKINGSIPQSTTGDIGIVKDIKVGEDYVWLTDDSELMKFSKVDLSLQYKYDYDSTYGFDSVAIYDNYVYISETDDDRMLQIYKTNGTIRQTQDGFFEGCSESLVANEYGVYAGDNNTGYVFKFSQSDLSVIEDYYLGYVQSIDVRGNYVYALSNRTIIKINMVTQSKLWERDTSLIMDNSRLKEIHYNPERKDKYPISVSQLDGNMIFMDDLGDEYITRYNKNKYYYLEGNNLYYGVTDDGRYKDNIYKQDQMWYKGDLGEHGRTDSYMEFTGEDDNITEMTVRYYRGMNVDLEGYDPSGDMIHYSDIWIQEFNSYSETISKELGYLRIDADKWDVDANMKYSVVQSWDDTKVTEASMTFKYNSTAETLKSDTVSISNTSNHAQTFNSDYTSMKYVLTENQDAKKTLDGNMTLKVTYIIYEKTGASDYIQLMSSPNFLSIIFLIMMAGFVAYFSQTAGIPVMTFVIGLYPLSIAGFLSWTLTIIITFLFGGFYILYSTKRENKV